MINSFRTLFEARDLKFQQERLFRGESVDLIAKITTDGVMDNLSGYSISGVYQPVDELSGPFYPLAAEIANGNAILHWTGENDFGKNAYNIWGLLEKDGKAAYPICWRISLQHSPSYPLSSVDPIPRTIDFSQYDLVNAPWLPLSGGNMEEGADIGFPISGDTYFTVSKDGFKKVEETTVETEAMSGYCWHELPDPVPEYEIQWLTESQIADWDPSTQGTPPWQDPRFRLCGTKPAESHTEKTTVASYSVPLDEEGERTLATREWTQENTDEKLNDYLPLSGGTVTGELSVTGTFESSNFKADAVKGIIIGYNAKAKSGSIAIGSSSDVSNAHFGGSNVAIGTAAKIGSTSETDCAVAVGNGTTVNGNYGIAIGHAADADGANSIAIGGSGSRVQALAPESIQIGGLSNGLWTPNNTPHSLKVFDKMVLSGDNLTLDPDRIPYLSSYSTKEWVEEYVAEHGGGGGGVSGDFLPLSGGTLSADNFKWLAADGQTNIMSVDYEHPKTAFGKNSQAGLLGTAVGSYANANMIGTAVGHSAKALSNYTVALGYAVSAIGEYSIAIGASDAGTSDTRKVRATDFGSIAIGTGAKSLDTRALAIGYRSVASQPEAIQIGLGTNDISGTTQVRDWQLLDDNGDIPEARLSSVLTSYAQLSDIPTIPDDLVHEEELTAYAQTSSLTAYAEKEELTAYAQTSSLTAYAEKEELTAYAQLSDIHDAPLSDYLPLSGGNLKGRIYLETTATSTIVVPGQTVTVEDESIWVGSNSGTEEDDGSGNPYDWQLCVRISASFDDMFGANAPMAEVPCECIYYVNNSEVARLTSFTSDENWDGLYIVSIDPIDPETDPMMNWTLNGDETTQSIAVDFNYNLQDINYSGYCADDSISHPTTTTVLPPTTAEVEVTVEDPFVISSELPDLSIYAKEQELTAYAQTSALTAYATTESLTAYASATDLQTLSNSVGDINTILDSINGEII